MVDNQMKFFCTIILKDFGIKLNIKEIFQHLDKILEQQLIKTLYLYLEVLVNNILLMIFINLICKLNFGFILNCQSLLTKDLEMFQLLMVTKFFWLEVVDPHNNFLTSAVQMKFQFITNKITSLNILQNQMEAESNLQ